MVQASSHMLRGSRSDMEVIGGTGATWVGPVWNSAGSKVSDH